MTDYERKLFELENANTEVDTFEGADDCLVIQEFINAYVFNEFIYTAQDKFIEKHTVEAYHQP